jgi:hypothetical protein
MFIQLRNMPHLTLLTFDHMILTIQVIINL